MSVGSERKTLHVGPLMGLDRDRMAAEAAKREREINEHDHFESEIRNMLEVTKNKTFQGQTIPTNGNRATDNAGMFFADLNQMAYDESQAKNERHYAPDSYFEQRKRR